MAEADKPDVEIDVPDLTLPREVEAEIAVTWSDNMAAATLTRAIARAMVHQGKHPEDVVEMIRNSGRVVD